MKRCAFSSLLLSAALGVLALPSAHAGGAINKCVDGAGRVTLTDQPCDARTVSASVAVPASNDNSALADNAPAAGAAAVPVTAPATASAARRLDLRTYAAPLRQARWVPATAPHAALAPDMATLKQARLQMLLQDAAPRTRLAVLDR